MTPSEYMEQLIKRMEHDMAWQIKGIVEPTEIEENGKTFAKVEGDKHLYEKQGDGYIIQWTRFEDDYYGILLVPLEGSKYLKIWYEC